MSLTWHMLPSQLQYKHQNRPFYETGARFKVFQKGFKHSDIENVFKS